MLQGNVKNASGIILNQLDLNDAHGGEFRESSPNCTHCRYRTSTILRVLLF